jgi:DNA-binding MarR family transcriptional regulator
MAVRAWLPTVLSQALIAFTIEFDNEFEHRMPHRTADQPGSGVWLTSMAMWSNFMRLIPDDGVPLRMVEGNGRITNLAGLQRWGYVSVEPQQGTRTEQVVRLKPGGRRAQKVWQPLTGQIEQRWRERFGDAAIDELRRSLSEVADPALPLYLPVVGYADGMRADHVRDAPGAPARDLAALLSQALLSFTLEYEQESALSLPMGADVVRVLTTGGVRVRDLPGLSGVSREGIASALGFLQRSGHAVIEPDPAGRGKLVKLTRSGLAAQAQHPRLVEAVEQRWRARLGTTFDRLRAAMITGERLALGLHPYPEGWRARNPYRARTKAVLADPATALAQYPMVLHRGGYPDGR